MTTAEPFSPPMAGDAHPSAGALAGFGRRLGAYVLDALIIGVGAGVIVGLMYVVGGADVAGIGYLLVIVGSLLYGPLLMARSGGHNGQTWGKQAVAVRVERDGGGPMTFGTGVVRDLLAKGLLGIFLLPTLASLVMVLVRADKKAIHDLIAATRVVEA